MSPPAPKDTPSRPPLQRKRDPSAESEKGKRTDRKVSFSDEPAKVKTMGLRDARESTPRKQGETRKAWKDFFRGAPRAFLIRRPV